MRGIRIPLIVAATILAGCGPSPASPSLPIDDASMAPATEPVANEAASTEPLEVDWGPVEIERPDRAWFAGAFVGAAGFVVVGGRYSDLGPNGLTWTSVDADSWVEEIVPGSIPPLMGATLESSEILVGVGETNACAHPAGEAIWTRRPGEVWVPRDLGLLLCAGGFPELVAGEHAAVVAGTGTGEQPFTWWSADGASWFDLPQPREPFAQIRGLTFAGGRFWMLARGDPNFILVRVSDDGRAWSPWAPIMPGGTEFDPVGMVPTDSGPIVVAVDVSVGAGASAHAWRIGVDGGVEAIAGWPIREPRLFQVRSVRGSDGSTWILATVEEGTDRIAVGRLLWTRDGGAWNEVPLPEPGLRIVGLADDGTQVLLITADDTSEEGTAGQVWVATSPAQSR